jgi:hypothetical protein
LQKAPGGYTHLLVAVDKFSKWIKVRPLNSIRSEQAVAFITNIIHRFGVPNPIITDNGTQFTGRKVPGLLRGSPHLGGLGRRGSPHDEWAGRTCQRHDSARTQASDLQRPQQVRQAVDEGTPLSGLESEDNTEPSHGLHTVLSSIWGRGRLAHRLRIRFPKDEGLHRPKQSSQSRRLTGSAGGGSGHGLTTLVVVLAVPATLPRPRGSVPRPPGGRPGASAATRRPRAAQAHASLGRAFRPRQGSESRNIQAGQQPRRGLQQCLEHPTATSLLPLRCFQVVRIPRSHTKSGRQGRVSLASAKPDPPSGARRGEPPLRRNFPRKKKKILSARMPLVLFDYFESGS